MQAIKKLLTLLISTLFLAGIFSSAPRTGDRPASPRAVQGRSLAGQARHTLNPLNMLGCGDQSVPVQNADFEAEIVALVNQERALQGAPPLKRNPNLDGIARYHAADLAQDNYFDHDTYDRIGEQLTFICIWDQRISPNYTEHDRLGENIAAGSSSPSATMSLWMNSSGHRANILSSEFWEIGVGYYAGSGKYYHYWVQDFGRPTDHYPMLIESEAASSDDQNVEIYIYGEWDEIRFNNDGGAWSAWLPFENEMSWYLPSTGGMHTVNAEMRSSSNSASSADTIYFAGGTPFIPTDFIYIPLVVNSAS